MTTQPPKILFLCTGNYYRSRFAEHLFNHHAPNYLLSWQAFSRGLAIELLEPDAGPISPSTLNALSMKDIELPDGIRSPIAVKEQDLLDASHIIALKHAEHYPLMSRKFPHWADRIEYWDVHDIDYAPPAEALPQIETAVFKLFERLA